MSEDCKPGNLLPNAGNAEIDPRKFVEYSMNPENPGNQGKSMAFKALVYNVENVEGRNAAAEDVIKQLREAVVQTAATQGQPSIYGNRFQVRVRIRGINGREGTLVTSWQIDNDKEVPRLITNWLEVDK